MSNEKNDGKGGFVVHVYSAGNQIIQTQTNNYYGTVYQGMKSKVMGEEQDCCPLTPQLIGKCVRSIQAYVWGKSSYATIYCVCRDSYDYDLSTTQFEHDLQQEGIDCPDGTISSTFYNNDFLHHKVEKWQSMGVKGRVIKLAEEFKKAVESERQENKP